MGLMQRRKGRAFEQRIARLFRERWPDAIVRRASQADRAYQSDVFVEGGPRALHRLWIECQDARDPTPIKKLHQAEADAMSWRLPVAVWHRTGERQCYVTTRMWVLDELREVVTRTSAAVALYTIVTVDLDSFLDLLSAVPDSAAREAA